MALVIEGRDLNAAHISEEELRLEIAILLYQQGRFSMGQAARFTEMNRILFQRELGKRELPVNYGVADFEEDLEILGIKSA